MRVRSLFLAFAGGLAVALTTGSVWAYRPGGGQSFVAPPPPQRRATAAPPPVAAQPPAAPAPATPAKPLPTWGIAPTPVAAPAEEGAEAAPEPAPPYQPSKSPTVFAALMLFGGAAAVGVALLRSRAKGKEQNESVPSVPAGLGGTPMSPLPRMGELFEGRYRVGEELERDELGVMFRANDEPMGFPVRLYLLRPEHTGSPILRARFRKQAHAWVQAGDPNRRVIDVANLESGNAYMVLGPT